MREFWVSSGHHLARRRHDGWLEVTDELLLAWVARPELSPPPDACPAERSVYARLRADPRARVDPGEIDTIGDADARENWRYFLGFRDRLLAAGSIESAFLSMATEPEPPPSIFLGQLTHLVMRGALDGCDDPFVLRAAELFWRPQRGSVRNGALLMVDSELVEDREAEARSSPLTAMFGVGRDEADVMTEANAWTYWSRSDAHAMALNWGGDPLARGGLAIAITAFLRHLLGVEARVETLAEVADVDFRWFVGLDAEATALGNALWRGLRPEGIDRLIGLFRLGFALGTPVEPRAAGHPVWLLLAMTQGGVVRLKPQNLIAGLPLAAASRAAG